MIPIPFRLSIFLDFFKKNIDLIPAAGGVFLAPVIAIYVESQIDIAIAIFLSCSVFLILRNRLISHRDQETSPRSFPRRYTVVLYLLFITCYLVNLIIYRMQNYFRPFGYFLILAFIAGVIAVQIYFYSEKENAWPILLQTILLGITIRWEIFYEYPTLFGSDPFEHAYIASVMLKIGSIPSFSVANKYILYPIFHIGIASTNLVTVLNIKDSMFLFLGLIHCLILILIFYIGKKVISARGGLTAVLLTTISTDMILRSVEIVPDTYISILFILMVYFVITLIKDTLKKWLILFLGFVMIITHQLATFASFIAVLGLFLGEMIYSYMYQTKEKIDIEFLYILTIFTAMFSYWLIGYNDEYRGFFNYVVPMFVSTIKTETEFGSDTAITTSISYSPVTNALFHMSYVVILFLSIGGILLFLSSREKRRYGLGVASLLLFAFVYGVAVFGIRNFLPGRWYPTMYVFLVLLASAFILQLLEISQSDRIKITAFVSIIMVIAFFGISSPELNKDNPLYSQERAIRTPLTSSELQSAQSINSVYRGPIKTDLIYVGGIQKEVTLNSTFSLITLKEATSQENPDYMNTLVLVRECMAIEPVLFFTVGTADARTRSIASRTFFESFNSPNYNQIYSNSGGITGYLAR